MINISFWIVLPTNISFLQSKQLSTNLKEDIWSIWADFRRSFKRFLDRLNVVLKFSEDTDKEFFLPKLLNRWNAEPVIYNFIL